LRSAITSKQNQGPLRFQRSEQTTLSGFQKYFQK